MEKIISELTKLSKELDSISLSKEEVSSVRKELEDLLIEMENIAYDSFDSLTNKAVKTITQVEEANNSNSNLIFKK